MTATVTSPLPRSEHRDELKRPRYRKIAGLGRGTLTQYAVLGVVALLVLAPVVPTLCQSYGFWVNSVSRRRADRRAGR